MELIQENISLGNRMIKELEKFSKVDFLYLIDFTK